MIHDADAGAEPVVLDAVQFVYLDLEGAFLIIDRLGQTFRKVLGMSHDLVFCLGSGSGGGFCHFLDVGQRGNGAVHAGGEGVHLLDALAHAAETIQLGEGGVVFVFLEPGQDRYPGTAAQDDRQRPAGRTAERVLRERENTNRGQDQYRVGHIEGHLVDRRGCRSR